MIISIDIYILFFSYLTRSRSMRVVFLISFIFSLLSSLSLNHGWDVLDKSQDNITIQWDIVQQSAGNYDARVTIFNYQLQRHIDYPPGWHLTWEWSGKEVISSMAGAEAKDQGVCNATDGAALPHCCLKQPVIIDRAAGTPFNQQAANCCRNGVLSTAIQDPSKSVSAFFMNVGYGGGDPDFSRYKKPENFGFVNPAGYTCGKMEDVYPPTKTPNDGGRRWTQALATWQVTCLFSQLKASPAPTCCVSLSSFYSPMITSCQNCSCGCITQPGSKCIKFGEDPPPAQPSVDPDVEPPPLVRCTNHMCPIKVHWHVKESYKEYWRVKMTITNMDVRKNYSSWNVAAEHPNMQSLVQVFSFNYRPLYADPHFNQSGLFWGIKDYNDMLLQSGDNGNVQTELLLHKDPDFTFDGGWAFPRRIYFNGQDCVMPHPVNYPHLPKEKPKQDKRFGIM